MLPATELVSLFLNILHVLKDSFALFRAGHLIDGGIESPLFFSIMGTEKVQQRLLFFIAVWILLHHFAMNGLKLLPDLAMLRPHHNGWPFFRPAGFLFPQRKQQILFPHDMALQADLEFCERILCLGEVRSLQLLEGLEQLIQPIMVLFKECSDGFLLTHDAFNTLGLLSDCKLQMTSHAGLQHVIELRQDLLHVPSGNDPRQLFSRRIVRCSQLLIGGWKIL